MQQQVIWFPSAATIKPSWLKEICQNNTIKQVSTDGAVGKQQQ
jgi:hypothetical protein